MRKLALFLLAAAGAASAQDAAQTPSASAGAGTATAIGERTPIADANGGARRIRSVTLAPGERCPPSTGDEVVVCYNGGNPYRIPPQLRNDQPVAAANQSWVNRASTIDQASRVNGGLPDTCSAVGTGGQSGCAQAYARAWAAEKREREARERVTPGE